ncbi:MAG: flippase [Bacteroidia bacterium]|nr:flippase [Bacteroidia bacterium]
MAAPTVQRFALNFWTLTVSRILYRAVSVGVAMYLARSLGAAVLGEYATVLNVLTLYLAFADLGVTNLVIRDVSRDTSLSADYLDNFFGLQLLVGVALVFLILGTGWISGYSELLIIALFIGSFGPLFSGLSNAYQGLMNAQQLFYPFAVIEIVCMLVFLAGNVLVVLLGGALLELVAVTSVVSLVKYALGAMWARRFGMRVRRRWDAELIRGMMTAGLPFLLINGAHFAIQRMDVLFLSWTVSEDRVGMYAAASRLIFASLFLVSSVGAMLYPQFSKALQEHRERAAELYARSTVYLTIAGGVTGLLFWQLAPHITAILYGEAFAESARILQILGLFIPLFSLGLAASNVLMVSDAVRHAVYASVIGLLAGAAASPYLIALYEIQGAAYAVLIAEAVAAVLYIGYTRRQLGFALPWRKLAAAALSCALPPMLLSLAGGETGWLQAGAGIAACMLLLFATRVLTRTDVKHVAALAGFRRVS